jgi:cold shock CspA family protein
MHGQITKFSEQVGFGVIEAEDGSKYRFDKSTVMNLNGRLVGHTVDFVVAARRPKDIILMTGSPWTAFGGNVVAMEPRSEDATQKAAQRLAA